MTMPIEMPESDYAAKKYYESSKTTDQKQKIDAIKGI
jgi:hypothetical protein